MPGPLRAVEWVRWGGSFSSARALEKFPIGPAMATLKKKRQKNLKQCITFSFLGSGTKALDGEFNYLKIRGKSLFAPIYVESRKYSKPLRILLSETYKRDISECKIQESALHVKSNGSF